MFGSIKKAMVAGAVVAVGALAGPAMASALEWQEGGTQYNGPAHVEGSLTLTLPATGAQTSCVVTGTLDLTNTGSTPWDAANGQLTTFALNNCTTTVPGCTITASAGALPWNVDTLGYDVTITGVNFTNLYSGVNCQLNGVPVTATGDITPRNIPGTNVIEFVSVTGLHTSLGLPAEVDGAVEAYAEDGTGGPDFSRPIMLG